MKTRLLLNSQELLLDPSIPKSAVSVSLRITVQPPGGRLNIYLSTSREPIECNGPVAGVSIPLSGRPLFAQLAEGGTAFQVQLLGWK